MSGTDWKARIQAAEAREVALRKRVQALADEWERRGQSVDSWGVSAKGIAREIRDTLRSETSVTG